MIFLFSLLLLFPNTAALSIQNGQENIPLLLEEGDNFTIFLKLTSNNGGEVVSAGGQAGSWILLGSQQQSSVVMQSGITFLPVTIQVPQGQGIGIYQAIIQTNASQLSLLTLDIALSSGGVLVLMDQADVVQKISDLEGRLDASLQNKIDDEMQNIRNELSRMEEQLKSSIYNVDTHQKGVAELTAEKETLEAEVVRLENELTATETEAAAAEEQKEQLELTGHALRTEGPILLVIGIMVGVGGMYLFYRRLHKYL